MKPELLPSGKYRCSFMVNGITYRRTFDTEDEALMWISDKQIEREQKKHDDFVERVFSVNPYIEIVGRFTNTKTKIKYRCLHCGEEYYSTPTHLLAGHGCATCQNNNTSYVEQYLMAVFINLVGESGVISRDKKLIGKELDIYIPSLNIAIEPGTWKFHRNKVTLDAEKRNLCKEKGVRLITVYYEMRNEELEYQDDVITYKNNIAFENDKASIKDLVNRLLALVNISKDFTDADYDNFHRFAYVNSRRMTTEEFVTKVSETAPFVNVLGEYSGAQARILCECKKCGNKWNTIAYSLLLGKSCKICSNREIAYSRMKTKEQFVEELNSIHPSIDVVGEYTGANHSTIFRCNVCKYEWEAKPNHILRPQGTGCPKCSRGIKRTHEEFVADVKRVNPDIEICGTFINTRTKVDCRCSVCGYEFSKIANDLLRGSGCRMCYNRKRSAKTQGY